MKKLILIANDAPQSGKTSFARVLEQHFERKDVKALAIYTDSAAAPDETAYWDLDEDLDTERLMRAVDENDALILDISTGCGVGVADFFVDHNLHDELLEFDAELCVAIVANDTESAINGCVALGEGFSDNANYLLLRNPYCDESEKGGSWAGSYAEKVMSYLGAVEVEVPEFDPEMVGELYSRGMDLPSGLGARKELPRYLRDALHSWELAYADALDGAADLLLPQVDSSRSVYSSSSVGS